MSLSAMSTYFLSNSRDSDLTSPSASWGLLALQPLLGCSHGERLRTSQQVKEFVHFRAQYQAGEEEKVLDVTLDVTP